MRARHQELQCKQAVESTFEIWRNGSFDFQNLCLKKRAPALASAPAPAPAPEADGLVNPETEAPGQDAHPAKATDPTFKLIGRGACVDDVGEVCH